MRDGGVTSGGVEPQIRCSQCADRHRGRMLGVALDTRRARRHLMASDPVMADLIRRAGPCRLGARRGADPFFLLLRAIVSQQLSTKAAATIFGRLCALFPDGAPTPARLLSARRRDAARRRAQHQQGPVRARPGGTGARRPARPGGPRQLRRRRGADALTAVLGIGTWTAEIFLLFQLHRPDIMPVGDLGLLTAMQRLYRMRARPTPIARVEGGRGVAAPPLGGRLVPVAQPGTLSERLAARENGKGPVETHSGPLAFLQRAGYVAGLAASPCPT